MSNLPTYAFLIEYVCQIGTELALRHTQRVQVKLAAGEPDPSPGTALSAINLETNGTGGTPGTATALDGISGYIAELLAVSRSTLSLASATMLYYPNGLDSVSIKVAPVDLGNTMAFPNTDGQIAGSFTPFQQSIITMNDSRGRTSRIVIAEHDLYTGDQNGFNDLSTEEAAFVNYLTGSTSVVRGAEQSRLLAMSRWSNSYNSAIERRRTR